MWKMWKGIRELESLQQAQSQGSLGEVGIDVLDEHGGEAGQVSARSLPAVNMELPLGPSQLCQGVVPVELDPLRSAWDGYGGAGGCACCLAGQDGLHHRLALQVQLVDKVGPCQGGVLGGEVRFDCLGQEQGVTNGLAVHLTVPEHEVEGGVPPVAVHWCLVPHGQGSQDLPL